MKAVLITYIAEDSQFRKIVEISDDHKWEDGPYVDTIPFSVGSNQAIVNYEFYENWIRFAQKILLLRGVIHVKEDDLTELFEAGLSCKDAANCLS